MESPHCRYLLNHTWTSYPDAGEFDDTISVYQCGECYRFSALDSGKDKFRKATIDEIITVRQELMDKKQDLDSPNMA